jgi:outer membrane lipoprotein-sorting protein
MPEIGADAMAGKKEHISGWFTFTVEEGQRRVVASGMLIMIYGQGQHQARWHGKDTGTEGQAVSQGERVQVYNTDVEFRR